MKLAVILIARFAGISVIIFDNCNYCRRSENLILPSADSGVNTGDLDRWADFRAGCRWTEMTARCIIVNYTL